MSVNRNNQTYPAGLKIALVENLSVFLPIISCISFLAQYSAEFRLEVRYNQFVFCL